MNKYFQYFKRSKWCYLLLVLVIVFLVLPKDTLASDVFTYQWVGDLTVSYITTNELSTLTGVSVLELRIGNIIVSGNIMRGMEIDFATQPSESALKKVDDKFPMLVRVGGLSIGDRLSVLENQPSSPQNLTWGNIQGTLSNQTDLINALNSKISTELDPVFTASVAYNISSGDISNWNGKLSTETDPVVKGISGIVKSNGTTISASAKGDADLILPDQIGNNGKYLTTNGANSSWASVTGSGGLGITLTAGCANQSVTTDAQTMYWGSMFSVVPSTTANRWRIYIPKTGTIKAAYVYSYSGTAGTNQNWSMYIRYDNTSDTLIQTLGVATNDRVWSNTGLNISVTQGHYIEIKEVQPTWTTNPANVTRTAVIYIE